jgi:hypothetical protein
VDDIFLFLLLTLGVYRLARLAATEDGPFDIFSKARDQVLARWGIDSWQHAGASCPLCIGFWFALIVALAAGQFWWWLPIAGLQTWLQKQERG